MVDKITRGMQTYSFAPVQGTSDNNTIKVMSNGLILFSYVNRSVVVRLGTGWVTVAKLPTNIVPTQETVGVCYGTIGNSNMSTATGGLLEYRLETNGELQVRISVADRTQGEYARNFYTTGLGIVI